MKKILSGTFEQVEDAISESFVENSLDTITLFKRCKVLFFIIFSVGMPFFIYGGGMVLVTSNIEDLSFSLDLYNEYRLFFSNLNFLWYPAFTAVLFISTVILTLLYRDKNNVKGHLVYYFINSISILLIIIQGFIFFQLGVNSFLLRMVYTILFICIIIFALIKGYKNAFAMVYGEKKNRSTIIEWASKHQKEILGVLFAFGGVNYFFKTVNDSVRDFERNIIGILIDFIPLIVSFVSLFAIIYFFSVLIRSYYLYKYSEEFRLKFGYEKEDWYGKDNQKAS